MLNKFPYNPGHLLVMPFKHVANFDGLNDQEKTDIFSVLLKARSAAKKVAGKDDLNIGNNEGHHSGGSVQDHMHIHIVPRFIGDTNFLAVIADTKVVSKDIIHMYDAYKNVSWE